MIKHIKNLSFQKKIFLVCLIVSFVPLAALGTFSHYQIKNLLIERERTALADTLQQETQTLSSKLSNFEKNISYICWNENLKQAMSRSYYKNSEMHIVYRDTINPLFSSLKSMNAGIDQISLYTDITIYPQKSTLLPLSDIKNTSWYPEVSNTYTPVCVVSVEDKTMFLACQMYNIENNYTAIVKMNINYDMFFSSFTHLFSDSYGVLITDQAQKTLYEFQTYDMPSHLFDGSSLKSIHKDFIIEINSDLNSVWNIYLYRPANIVSAPANAYMQIVFLIILICFFCIILLSFFMSKVLVQPLKNLEANMKEVELGSYTVTVDYHASDEIGQLFKAFKSMLDQINHLVNEVLKSKISQQEQEMRALQSQINPHFLYNSLSLINSRAILNNQPEIAQTAQYLSSFYRTSLNKGKNIIAVQDELQNIRSYINIQLLMHSDSFDVVYDIDDEILSCLMINLLLQPLVENAIMHGIDHSQEPRGWLKIIGKHTTDTLIFQISDNGPGIPEYKLSHIYALDSTGYGIKNVNRRIQLSYGTEYGLSYQSKINAGTTVTLTLPIIFPK